MSSHTSIKNIVVLGATGNIGPAIISSLLKHPADYNVTAISRDRSKVKLPDTVTIVESDYSSESLGKIFQGQDAVVSAVAMQTVPDQTRYIDVAIESGVRHFIPSEYGMDSSHPKAREFLPPLGHKQDVVAYLRKHESRISWSAVIVGAFFDWSFTFPPFMGWDVRNRKATIYNGGDIEFEATNLKKIGDTVAAILAPEHLEKTTNQYVYVNSVTTTQKEVLAALEKHTGDKFDIVHASREEVYDRAQSVVQEDQSNGGATLDLITVHLYNARGLNHYSKEQAGGLWNVRLGLERESVDETVAVAVKRL